MKIRKMMVVGMVALAGLASHVAQAAYPEYPIRLILPFSPGGSSDLVARAVAQKASTLLNQSIVIDNRPGAGGVVATSFVANAKPDGYTLLFAQSSHAANPSLLKKLPYDTEKSFTPIALLADHPGVLLASPKTPYNTFAEFLAYAKANPGKVKYASAGIGTWPHLTMAMLASDANLKMVHVPYAGAAPSRIDLLAGRVDVKVEAYATVSDLIKAHRLKALAVTGKERTKDLPDVPTIAESGFPGFDSSIWMAVLGPANLPPDVTKKLEDAFTAAAKDPGVVKQLADQGIFARGLPASAVSTLIHTEVIKWHKVLTAAGIKPM
ncbi:MAG TPA: tripartite tricarboxylate transporter substrate binding protein [Paraburkholderia sp.]